jgi:hypothetical protein
MSTKTFKVGEYGFNPVIKIFTKKNHLEVQKYNWQGEHAESRTYSYDAIHNLELDMCEEVTSYYASKMVDWVHSTKEYKATKRELDPFTSYTFN